jgi:hypothetical protein
MGIEKPAVSGDIDSRLLEIIKRHSEAERLRERPDVYKETPAAGKRLTSSSPKEKPPKARAKPGYISREPLRRKKMKRVALKQNPVVKITYHVKEDNGTHPVANAAFLSLLATSSPKTAPLASRPIAIIGDGPWLEEDLKQFLNGKYGRPSSLKPDVGAVILGSRNVATARIRRWLDKTGATDRIYPQELFLLYALTGSDPLATIDRNYASEWVRMHPVLNELFGDVEADFEWLFSPELEAQDEWFDEHQEVIHLPYGDSPLAKMGYTVGIHFGLPPAERRKILSKAFGEKIPRATSHANIDEYMKQWGSPKTSQRLWRIARHLAGQIYLKRRNITMGFAVSEWADDLKWLHKHVYPQVRFKFCWPRDFD